MAEPKDGTPATQAWRDVIEVHPACAALPRISDAESKALGKDIRKNGLRTPIVLLRIHPVAADGTRSIHNSKLILLDGASRLDAIEAEGFQLVKNGQLARDLGLEAMGHECPLWDILDESDVDPAAVVASLNVHRRHLSAEDKRKARKAIEKLIKEQPTKSNRQIARETGVSHPHIAKVREEMEQAGDVETLPRHTDIQGREQPAHKPPIGMPSEVNKAGMRAADRKIAERAKGGEEVSARAPTKTERKGPNVEPIDAAEASAALYPKTNPPKAAAEEAGELAGRFFHMSVDAQRIFVRTLSLEHIGPNSELEAAIETLIGWTQRLVHWSNGVREDVVYRDVDLAAVIDKLRALRESMRTRRRSKKTAAPVDAPAAATEPPTKTSPDLPDIPPFLRRQPPADDEPAPAAESSTTTKH
jgi:hypothetical protein